MSQQSFAELGLSQPVVGALADRGMHRPPSPSRPSSSRTCWTASTCSPSPPRARARRSPSSRRSSTCSTRRARKPAALVLAPTRELVSQIVEEARPLADARRPERRRRLRRRRLREADQATPAPRTCWSRRPAGSRTCSRAARSRSPTSRSSSSTRPTGCSTWASARPSTGSSRQCPADRQTLFFSPRSTARPAASRPSTRPTRSATSTRPTPETRAEIEHRFRAVDRDSRIDALVDELDDAELALVFVRTKRGADRLVKRLDARGRARRRDARQQVPEPARARAGRVRLRQGRHARRHRRRRPRHRRRPASRT